MAHLALLCVAAIYSINYIWAKDVMPAYVQSSGFILLRVLGASLLFFILHLTRGFSWPDKGDVGRIFLCGMLGVAGNQLFFFKGLSMTSPVNSSIIMTISPLLVVVLGALLHKDTISVQRWIGLAIAGSAALALIIIGSELSSIQSHPLGDFFILLNASFYATYLVVVQPLMKKYPPIKVIQWVFLAGLCVVLPIGFNQVLEIEWAELPSGILLRMSFVIVFTTFIAYLFNIYAISKVGSAVTGMYIYLQPFLASVFAALSGMEIPSLFQILMGVLVILGVFIGSRNPSTKKVVLSKP